MVQIHETAARAQVRSSVIRRTAHVDVVRPLSVVTNRFGTTSEMWKLCSTGWMRHRPGSARRWPEWTSGTVWSRDCRVSTAPRGGRCARPCTRGSITSMTSAGPRQRHSRQTCFIWLTRRWMSATPASPCKVLSSIIFPRASAPARLLLVLVMPRVRHGAATDTFAQPQTFVRYRGEQ